MAAMVSAYSETKWTSEKLFFSSREFFSALFAEMEKATVCLRFEVYIFCDDQFGRLFIEKIKEVAKRGVRVQLLVDGVGAWGWYEKYLEELVKDAINVRVFRPIPWPFSRYLTRDFVQFKSIPKGIGRLNNRNHKKCFIIDDQKAFIGSMNVHAETLQWRETGAEVTGPPVRTLVESFEWSWTRAYSPIKESKIRRWHSISQHPLVKVNHPRRLRKARVQGFLQSLSQSTQRVWLVTPYFLPTPALLTQLVAAANRGCDVRIILPHQSDHPILTWASRLFFQSLIETGVRIYSYQSRFCHAKTVLCDSRVQVGSTNLNHRSFFHDLELDVELVKPESAQAMEKQFIDDLRESREVRIQDLNNMSWWSWLQGKLALLMKAWL